MAAPRWCRWRCARSASRPRRPVVGAPFGRGGRVLAPLAQCRGQAAGGGWPGADRERARRAPARAAGAAARERAGARPNGASRRRSRSSPPPRKRAGARKKPARPPRKRRASRPRKKPRPKAEAEARRVEEAAAAAANAARTTAPVARAADDVRRAPRPAAPRSPRRAGRDAAPAACPRRRGGGGIPPDPPQPDRRCAAAAQAGDAAPKKGADDRRRAGRIDVQAAIEGEDDRVRSLASVRRQRERERRQAELERLRSDQVKVVREVVLPDHITVQELANRMAARAPRCDQDADEDGRDGDHHAEPGRRHRRAGGAGIRPSREARLRGRCRNRPGRRG